MKILLRKMWIKPIICLFMFGSILTHQTVASINDASVIHVPKKIFDTPGVILSREYLYLLNTSPDSLSNRMSSVIPKDIPMLERNPIFIDGNNDFDGLDFLGSGTVTDPYVLSGCNITSSMSTLIHIQNTDVYLVIRNNILNGLNGNNYPTELISRNWSGIHLTNVTHAKIINNTICHVNYGILMRDSVNNNTVENNHIYHCYNTGLDMDTSVNNTIASNVINDTQGIDLFFSPNNILINNSINNTQGEGISMHGCNNCILSYNTISYSADHCFEMYECSNNFLDHNKLKYGNNGISISHSSNNNTISGNIIHNHFYSGINIRSSANFNAISNNTIYNCTMVGFSLQRANENIILNNTIFGNSGDGITLGYATSNSTIYHNLMYNNSASGIRFWRADNNSIWNNTFYNNGYGIILHYGVNNMIKWNDFIDNNINGTSQALIHNISNTIISNYWNEWSGPDKNVDGIADVPYPIGGKVKLEDPFPLVVPNNPSPIEYFSGEPFTYATANAKTSGSVHLFFGVLVALGLKAYEKSRRKS